MAKTVYIVFNIPPGDKERHFVPCSLGDENILWLEYPDPRRSPTAFKNRQQARNAVRRSQRYTKRNNLVRWSNEYKIVPVKF